MKPRKSNITFSDDAALEYIMALENPHKVGWDSKNRVWRTPKEKGYDKNQIAYGLDIRQDHNPVVYNFLKEKGRLKDPWLTDAEARNLMLLSYSTKGSSVEKAIEKAGGKISQRGYNVLRGMAWHGHPMKQLLNPDSVTGKAFLRAIANGDQDLNSVFDTYYGYGSNATQFADRIKADAKLRGSIVMETLGDGNKRMTFKPIPQWLPKPLPKPIPETQYPLSGSQAPESLSSWNAALSPSATPTIPSIQKLNNEQLKAVQGAFLLPEVTVLGNRRTSLLPKMPSLNDALMAYSPLNQMNRAVSDMLGLNDLWEDFDVTSDLFKAKNGKLPKYNTGLVPGLTEERSDNTRVVRPEIHLPVKRQLLKKLVTVELMLLATRNKPVLSQDAESRHGAPKAETFIGEMARVAGKDFVKADRASVAASMANPIANAALGSMDLGMNLNRSLHENTIDQNANTTLSALAILPFVRNGLKMAKAKDWVGKFRDWYENAITTANNPNEVNRALLMSRYWNAVDDSHTLDAVTNKFRNQEWSNFLTTKNGDSYYRIGIDGKPINNAEKYFMSHTTPWEEFSGLGTELPMGADILYEFPTKTFGRLMSTTDKGIKTGYDVVDMGKNHLLYGNTASGQRGFVKTVPDNVAEQAKANGIDVQKIGILDRPLKPNGIYDTRPVYEDIYMGNQTAVGGRRLNNALLNTEYKIYRRTPNGIQTEIYSPGMYTGQTPDWRNPINNALNVKQLDAMLGEFVGKGADAADDAHVPQIVLGSTVDDNPFKSPIDKSSLLLFNDMKRLLIRKALSQTGNGVSSGIDIAKDPYSLRNLSRDVVHHEGMPDEVEDIFRYQILPRTNISKMNYDNTIDILSRYGYNTLDDYNWAKYVDDDLAGYLDNSTYAIALREPYIREAAPHEFRHRMLHLVPYKRSLAIDRNAYLNKAYDEDFVNLPNIVDESDSLHGYPHMADEKATTNLDARMYAFNNFTDNPNIGKLSVTEQNKFLDSLSDDLIIEAVERSNGYGRRFISFLNKKYDFSNNPKVKALRANYFRNAMKYYGVAAIPTAMVTSTMLKQEQ